MDGDLADLPRLVALKQQYKTFLYLDEAHSFGVLGKNGFGLAESLGLVDEVDFIVGTFGKVLASLGAFVVCNAVFKQYLVNKARSLIYSTALPPVNVLWTKFVLDRFPEFAARRAHLQVMANQLRTAILDAGMQTMGSCHIVPLVLGSNENAVRYSEQLKTKGFWAMPVRTPTVPEGTARIRFSLSSALSDEDVAALCDAIRSA
jgi:8-amino-7-oxononanoate synthase